MGNAHDSVQYEVRLQFSVQTCGCTKDRVNWVYRRNRRVVLYITLHCTALH